MQKYLMLLKLYNINNTPVDISSITTYLINCNRLNEIGGVQYLNEVVNSVATGANIEYYISLVSEKYTLRKMIEVATDIVNKATNSEMSASDTIDEAEKEILNIY